MTEVDMSPETGWEAVRVAFRCGRELQNLLPRLKADCEPQDYRMFLTGIAKAIDAINVELIDRTLRLHPQLKARIEAHLDRDGMIR